MKIINSNDNNNSSNMSKNKKKDKNRGADKTSKEDIRISIRLPECVVNAEEKIVEKEGVISNEFMINEPTESGLDQAPSGKEEYIENDNEVHSENEDIWNDEEWDELLQALHQNIIEVEQKLEPTPASNSIKTDVVEKTDTDEVDTTNKEEFLALREKLDQLKTENTDIRKNLSDVEAEKSILLEKVENVIDGTVADVIKVRRDHRKKIKKLETRKNSKEAKLRKQYEKRLREILNANNKCGSRRETYPAIQTGSPPSAMDDNMDDNMYDEQQEYEDTLQKLQNLLRLKSLDYEKLEARYEEQERLVDFLSSSLEYETSQEKETSENVLRVLDDLECSIDDLRQENLCRTANSVNIHKGTPFPESLSNFDNGLNSTWPPRSNNKPDRISSHQAWRSPRRSVKVIEFGQESYHSTASTLTSKPIMNKWTSVDALVGEGGNANGGHLSPGGNLSADSGINSSSFKSTSSREANIKQVLWRKKRSEDHLPSDNGDLRNVANLGYTHTYRDYPRKVVDHGYEHKLADRNYLRESSLQEAKKAPVSREISRNSAMTGDSGLFDDGSILSNETMFHNITEMLKKLEEKHGEIKERGLSDHIWSLDLDIWKHRTYYRMNALRVLLGGENIPSCSPSIYKRVLFHPDDSEVNDIIRRVNLRYEVLRRNYPSRTA